VRVGLVCGAGAGKISQFPTGEGRGEFKFCGCGAGAVKKFQPVQDWTLISSKLDISHNLSRLPSVSIASKSKLKFCHTKLFINHLFSNNGYIWTQSVISHS